MRPRGLLVLVLAASLLAPGCAAPSAWRVPLAPSKAAPGAQACVETCDYYSGEGRVECLSKCPGSVKLDACPSPKEDPKVAACAGTEGSALAVATLTVLVLAVLAIVVYDENRDFCPGC